MTVHWKRSLLVALALAGFATTSGARVVVYVRTAPPPVIVEQHELAPSPNHIWISGYHHWDGSSYAWVTGHWEPRPRAQAVWIDGRWRHSHHGWYWRDGYWRH